MPMSETQLSGLKKATTAITDEDLNRILIALGHRRVQTREPGELLHTMKIDGTWQAQAQATEIPSDSRHKIYRVDLYVIRTADGVRLGPVYRTEDMFVLQRRGAQIMSELFQSVDDLSVFACPKCEGGLLTWDGNKGGRTTKAGMRCCSCDWTGHTGKFLPYREMR